MPNINLETGIRFGLISSNSLDPEVIYDLQVMGRDVHWEMAKAEIVRTLDYEMAEGAVSAEDYEDELEYRLEREGDSFDDDEPVHEFQRDGVRGQTTWLGGALLVWVFHSPFVGVFKLCSPCVPGACDLDSPLRENIGHIGYDVPPTWRIKMSAPHITWMFEVTHDITRYTCIEAVAAPVDADLDMLVSDLAVMGCYAIRLDRKEWEHRAWPGGYPIFYITSDGGVLCSKCANDNIKLTSDPDAESDWRIVASDINYEDPDLFCDHCGERCESAYGDNNEQDKDPT